MARQTIVLLWVLFSNIGLIFAFPKEENEAPKKSVIIMIDGFRHDYASRKV
jgi:predicted AlkP superfamily pyrophosphatase or phosphodiesterase